MSQMDDSIYQISKSSIFLRGKYRLCWLLSHINGYDLWRTINMDIDEFNTVMMYDFKGFEWNTDRYLFYNENNALNALDWIESRYVIVKLSKV